VRRERAKSYASADDKDKDVLLSSPPATLATTRIRSRRARWCWRTTSPARITRTISRRKWPSIRRRRGRRSQRMVP